MARQGLSTLLQGSRKRSTEESREIELDRTKVRFTLRRAERKTFGLQVSAAGIVKVSVPLRAREADVTSFLANHAAWLVDKLTACKRNAPVAFKLNHGAVFPVLGESCRINLEGGRGRSSRWRGAIDGVEELVLPPVADPQAVLIRALRARAILWFRERVAEYCYRLGVPVPRVGLSSARTRWGSCSTRSGIRLHWRLIHLSPALIDYVVAHEVAHLIEMNHSSRFWGLVERIYPDWKDARRALRDAARLLPLMVVADAGAALEEN